jgi:lipopolysaccharide/colanic/teichoic acid biosynthesis glycosyltransferase
LLALGAPLLAVLAVIVRATSTGPSLFRQTRVGEGGRTFTIFKFRTMVVDAEARKAELLAANEADGVLFKMQNDPRITRVGGTLRKLGLDELPQLINVLRGEMSLVGPRPPLPDETARYDEWVAGRLKVKPGITGLWQVNGRHELSFADYIRYDLFYVENWSVSLDLYVIARTLPALLARRGAA